MSKRALAQLLLLRWPLLGKSIPPHHCLRGHPQVIGRSFAWRATTKEAGCSGSYCAAHSCVLTSCQLEKLSALHGPLHNIVLAVLELGGVTRRGAGRSCETLKPNTPSHPCDWEIQGPPFFFFFILLFFGCCCCYCCCCCCCHDPRREGSPAAQHGMAKSLLDKNVTRHMSFFATVYATRLCHALCLLTMCGGGGQELFSFQARAGSISCVNKARTTTQSLPTHPQAIQASAVDINANLRYSSKSPTVG